MQKDGTVSVLVIAEEALPLTHDALVRLQHQRLRRFERNLRLRLVHEVATLSESTQILALTVKSTSNEDPSRRFAALGITLFDDLTHHLLGTFGVLLRRATHAFLPHSQVLGHELLLLVLSEREVRHALSCLGLRGLWLYWKSLTIRILLPDIVIPEVQDSLKLLLNALIELFGLGRLLSHPDRSGLSLQLCQRGRHVRFNIIMATLFGQGRSGVEEGDIGRDVLQQWFGGWFVVAVRTGGNLGLRGLLGDGQVGPLAMLAQAEIGIRVGASLWQLPPESPDGNFRLW